MIIGLGVFSLSFAQAEPKENDRRFAMQFGFGYTAPDNHA